MFRRTALVTAALVITAGMALTGCSAAAPAADSAPGSSSSAATAPKPAASKPAASKAPGLNVPVKVGTFEFTVTGAKDAGTTVGDSILSQTAQGTFIEVDFVVKNVGDSAATFLSNYVKLRDADGKTFDADPTATLYASPSQQAWVASINPGNSVTSPILFDVPAGTTAASVQVSDRAFAKGETIALQ